MNYPKDTYSALRKEIASLSLDPFLLTDEDLGEILETRKRLTDASLSVSDGEIVSSLYAKATKTLCAARERASAKLEKAEKALSAAYDSLLSVFAELLSADPLSKTQTVWFSPLTDAERRSLEDASLVFTSQCGEIQRRLIALNTTEESVAEAVTLRKTNLAQRIALLLAFPKERQRITDEDGRLSTVVSEIEEVAAERERLKKSALRVAVELIPPFLEELSPLLLPTKKENARSTDAADVRHIASSAEGVREQIRRTLEPIIKK